MALVTLVITTKSIHSNTFVLNNTKLLEMHR